MNADTSLDGVLDRSIQYRCPRGINKTLAGPRRVAFLTGATGFLGANLLHELLTQTSLHVLCLVRSESDVQARARLRAALELQMIWDERFENRFSAIQGDLSKPQLGLTDDAFRSLGDGIGIIYHNAAQIGLAMPYRGLRRTNVLGTRELLRLASIGLRKVFHHVSSLAVFRSSHYERQPAITENFELDKLAVPPRGYARSKWIAEQLVNEAVQRGLDACIYRPDLITANSRTGVCNLQDSLSLMFRACVRLGAAPLFPGQIHFTPVDIVSCAIITLSQNQKTGLAFHIRNPTPMSWNRIVNFLLAWRYVERAMPYGEWLQLLRAQAALSPDRVFDFLLALLSDSQPPYPERRQRVDDANTVAGLSDYAERFPASDELLLSRSLLYLASVP